MARGAVLDEETFHVSNTNLWHPNVTLTVVDRWVMFSTLSPLKGRKQTYA